MPKQNETPEITTRNSLQVMTHRALSNKTLDVHNTNQHDVVFMIQNDTQMTNLYKSWVQRGVSMSQAKSNGSE